MNRTAIIAALLIALFAAPDAQAKAKPLVPAATVTWIKGAPPGGWWEDARAASAGATVWYRATADEWDRAHEMGHVFVEQYLTDADKRRLQGPRVMRVKGPWIGDWGEGSPDECFADWYANARLGQGPGFKDRRGVESWSPGYGVSEPTVRRYRRFIKIVNRAASR